MYMNVIRSLCSLPTTDLNFTAELKRATSNQIRLAIETMKQNGRKNKGRIKACERELENRRLTKKDKHGKYVSKKHLSILCNTFSSEHRLKAILNKLGELEDAERRGLILQLPCEEVNGMNNKWIPITERLPEDGIDVLVWFEYFRYGDYNRLFRKIGISYTYNGEWSGFVNGQSGWRQLKVIAWMPLPDPYSADSEKPKTNADRIRNMSDEELAEFLVGFKNTFGEEYEGESSCMEWLQSEAEMEENDA